MRSPQRIDIAEPIYEGGLVNGWQDWGWTTRELSRNGPAKVRFDNFGGWIIAKPGLTGNYGGVVFQEKVPVGEAEFLEVRVESNSQYVFPRIKIGPDNRTDLGDGWTQVFVSMSQLDPDDVPFDRIVLRAFRPLDPEWIYLDKIALVKGSGAPRAAASYDPASLPRAELSVDCRGKSIKISPLIYGIAYYAFNDAKAQSAQWLPKATARRWGGNTTSTYNWEINAWNTGNDYFFENHEVMPYTTFLKEDAEHGMKSALTVPIMGWVSKDTTSSSFPVSAFGPQEATDQYRPDAGNGKAKGTGKPITPGPQSRAYMPITPDFVKRWVEAIRAADAKTGHRSVDMYILDNEPMIWNTTHRDAHPDPLSYDELVQRTIDFGTAVRQADPDAVIAGPAEWGWTGYMYSAKDMANGGPSARPDRRAHGDVPVIAYYLKALAAYEKKSGVRVLDVLDLHAYPYGDGVSGDSDDPQVASLRVRSTRMLWDPNYVDESWVKEPIRLLPRMREWIDQNYPGRGISLGEWNFGGASHMSGGLATAEALGRFAQYGVTSAFYWTYPPANSPAMWAFRAYRDFDGKGGHFLDEYVPSKDAAGVSLFASRDASGGHLVAVVLNLSKQNAVSADIDLGSCGGLSSYQSYSYAGSSSGFAPGPGSKDRGRSLVQTLPPYSITVLDVQLDHPNQPSQ